MPFGKADVLTVTLLLLSTVAEHTHSVPLYDSGLEDYLAQEFASKRAWSEWKPNEVFNSCGQQKPFPCKTMHQCISLKHVCDGNFDCDDGWDEDESVCVAYQRVPIEDLTRFVYKQRRWLMDLLFDDNVEKTQQKLDEVAHALSVSPTIDDFQRRLGLTRSATRRFNEFLNYVREDQVSELEQMGMPADAHRDVTIIFQNLIDSGFLG